MHKPEHISFRLLKQKVAETFLQRHAASDPDISNWKGEDITAFQDDLMDKVRGGISEKWFYTHIKGNSDKLPRIDMLNLLSKYAGYENWADFQLQHQKPTVNEPTGRRFSLRWVLTVGAGLLIALAVAAFWPRTHHYRFCFVDVYRKAPISAEMIEVLILSESESPRSTATDGRGCFHIESGEKQLRFIVRSPYYKTDTIVRMASTMIEEEQVSLHTNDYAWMIDLFANAQVEDWKKRRAQLDEMIADEARIYQIYNEQSTHMALYNKEEFINKLTMPTQSLKNIEIVETIYAGDQIMVMRFIQQTPSTP